MISLWAFIEVTSWVIFILRIAAGIGGAILGWFLFPMLIAIVHRLVRRRSFPRALVPFCRVSGAILVGLLFYLYAPIGGGGGGLGWGAGPGGGNPGAVGGPGQGDVKLFNKTKDAKGNLIAPERAPREVVDIEIIGGARYQGDKRFYLRRGADKAETLEEIEATLKARTVPFEARILLVNDSPGDPGPKNQLSQMLSKNGFYFLVRDETEK